MAQLVAAASRSLNIIGCQTVAVSNMQRYSAFRKTESAVIATRNAVQGISGWLSRTRRFRTIAATADGNEEGEVQGDATRATTLKQLDQQLATMAEREDSSVSRPSLGPSVQQMRPVRREPGEQGKNGEVEWPDFSAGFLGFMAFAMLSLTVVNNILYRSILGPPAVPFRLGDPVQSSVGEERRYRIRSSSEEREERKGKVTAAHPQTFESKVAPTGPALSFEE